MRLEIFVDREWFFENAGCCSPVSPGSAGWVDTQTYVSCNWRTGRLRETHAPLPQDDQGRIKVRLNQTIDSIEVYQDVMPGNPVRVARLTKEEALSNLGIDIDYYTGSSGHNPHFGAQGFGRFADYR